MKNWMTVARERSRMLATDVRGATMVEYIVIISLVFLVGLTAWQNLGKAVTDKTKAATDALNTRP
jgi:Flp pilus assembly pilin Flp